ncbi:MAG: hypothetical protein JHC71_02680 [Blastococcus sp.]|nr:hypothetical protein [Blastococcus sp.]
MGAGRKVRFHALVLAAVSVLLALLVLPEVARAQAPVQDLSSQGRAAIDEKYAQLGGDTGPLGPSRYNGATCSGWIFPGCVMEYANGRILWSATTGARAVTRPDFYAEWSDLRNFRDLSVRRSAFGFPVSDTVCGLSNGGCTQHFQNGSLYWSPSGGLHTVYGDVLQRWGTQGWERGQLGYPTSDQTCTDGPAACMQHFQGGSIVWSADTAVAHAIRGGPMWDRWIAAQGTRGQVGHPTSAAFCGLRNGACGQHFENGSIYWVPGRPAYTVTAYVSSRWAAQGWERGPLGYPIGNTFCGLAFEGCGQHFEGGSVYRMVKETPPRMVSGAIRDAWARQGWENGRLGYPMGEAFCGLRGGGCGQHFAQGTIYWSPATGARFLYGRYTPEAAIWHRWERDRWENGPLGYPVGNPICGLRNGGCGQHFQGGSVYFSLGSGPVRVSGTIRDKWAAQGWENGRLGYPVSEVQRVRGVWVQYFQGGQLRI